MRLDASGIRTEQVARDGVHMRLDRVGEEERLSEPDEPLIRVHEHVDEARELVEAERVDSRDLHVPSRAR